VGPRRPTVSTLFDSKDVVSTTLTKRQLGNKVLEMYSDLLCDKENNANIQKFARTVTNKVCSITI
jgi:beige protein homolog 1